MRYFIFAGLLALVPVAAAVAATVPANPAPVATASAPGAFTITAARQELRDNGMTLEGTVAVPARLHSDDLDLQAPFIDFSWEGQKIQRIEAKAMGGKVTLHLKYRPARPGAVAQPPSQVDAVSQYFLFVVPTRELTLEGAVQAAYQIATGQARKLQAAKVQLAYGAPGALKARAEGSVVVELPGSDLGRNSRLGPVQVNAQTAWLDDAAGKGEFLAKAGEKVTVVSTTGAERFNLSAPGFSLRREPGQESIRSTGAAHLEADLPPPEPPASAQPTHVEANAREVVLLRPQNGETTLTMNGDVAGYYRMAAGNGPLQDYNFKADQALFTRAATAKGGVRLVLTGAPSTVQVPGLNLNLE